MRTCEVLLPTTHYVQAVRSMIRGVVREELRRCQLPFSDQPYLTSNSDLQLFIWQEVVAATSRVLPFNHPAPKPHLENLPQVIASVTGRWDLLQASSTVRPPRHLFVTSDRP